MHGGGEVHELLQAPAWVFFVVALSVFNYQLFDAIDGKQVVLLCSAVCA